jgi:hypothetical protein
LSSVQIDLRSSARPRQQNRKNDFFFFFFFFLFPLTWFFFFKCSQTLLFLVVIVGVLACAFAQQCADRIKGFKTVNPTPAEYKAVCMACQADPECEYCLGMCFHESIGGGNEILCNVKRNAIGKRDSFCDGKINIMDAGTHVQDVTVSGHGQTTTQECLAGAAGCAGGTNSHATATQGDKDFSGFAPPTTSTQYVAPPASTKPGIVIAPGGQNQMNGDATKKVGGACVVNGKSSVYDKCLVCGGTGKCSSASTLAVSTLLVAMAAGAML